MNRTTCADRQACSAGVGEDKLRGIGAGYRDAGDRQRRGSSVGHGDGLQSTPGTDGGCAKCDAGGRQSYGRGRRQAGTGQWDALRRVGGAVCDGDGRGQCACGSGLEVTMN